MMQRVVAYLLAIVLLVLPCAADARNLGDRLHIEGVSRITHLSRSGANVWLSVENNTSSRLVLKRCAVDVMVDGRCCITLSLRDKVVIRRGTDEVLLPLRFESRSGFVLLRVLRHIVKHRGEGVTISYNVRAGTPLFKRSFSGVDIAVSEIFDTFAISSDDIQKLIDRL